MAPRTAQKMAFAPVSPTDSASLGHVARHGVKLEPAALAVARHAENAGLAGPSGRFRDQQVTQPTEVLPSA